MSRQEDEYVINKYIYVLALYYVSKVTFGQFLIYYTPSRMAILCLVRYKIIFISATNKYKRK